MNHLSYMHSYKNTQTVTGRGYLDSFCEIYLDNTKSTFIVPQSNTNYNFYPRIIRDWSNLPISLIEARDVNAFRICKLALNHCIANQQTIIGILYKCITFSVSLHPMGTPAELFAQYQIKSSPQFFQLRIHSCHFRINQLQFSQAPSGFQ